MNNVYIFKQIFLVGIRFIKAAPLHTTSIELQNLRDEAFAARRRQGPLGRRAYYSPPRTGGCGGCYSVVSFATKKM